MSAQIKDYPGTGCPICHTRQNLNECIGGQYLTVQELIHMVSHWRSEIIETGFGGEELQKAMKSALAAGFAYYQSFSNWRMAHEQAEMLNFVAEDYTAESLNAYEQSLTEEETRLTGLTSAMDAFAALYDQLCFARGAAILSAVPNPHEHEHFQHLTNALDVAKQMMATTIEARARYSAKMTVYASKRKAKVMPVAVVPVAVSKGCGCGGKS